MSHPAVAEAAVVGVADEMKGQALVVFVTLKQSQQAVAGSSRASSCEHVGKEIGKFARPDASASPTPLPKTRSGKIMRRLLRDLAAGKQAQGDMTTLEDISVLAKLRAEEDE